jgi:hypothetical protein
MSLRPGEIDPKALGKILNLAEYSETPVWKIKFVNYNPHFYVKLVDYDEVACILPVEYGEKYRVQVIKKSLLPLDPFEDDDYIVPVRIIKRNSVEASKAEEGETLLGSLIDIGPELLSDCLSRAVFLAKGLPDNYPGLTILRRFRDSYLLPSNEGRLVVEDHYKKSPLIIGAIRRISDPRLRKRVINEIYEEGERFIVDIKNGKPPQEITRNYKEYLAWLFRYLALPVSI